MIGSGMPMNQSKIERMDWTPNIAGSGAKR